MTLSSAIFAVAGAVAAVGPVLIHLLNRRRYRAVDWAAMDFLREALKRSRRIVQLRDLLLLALRTACVLLFGLAMARPYWSARKQAASSGQPVHAVLVIDNSLSMAYQRLDGTLLDAAKKQAEEFIGRLPQGSRITVLPLCGAQDDFSLDAYRTKDDALDALQAIEVADRSGNAAQAADLALAACQQTRDLPAKRVVFLGDQQAVNWPPGSLTAQAGQLPDMQVVHVAADAPENAWVSELKLQDGIADVETPATLVATVRYEGAATRANVPVSLSVDGVEAASQVIDLEPGQARQVSFSYRFDMPVEPGLPAFATAAVSLPPDRLAEDDSRALVVPVVAALPVVFVDQYGEAEDPKKNQYGETYRLRRLLAPVTSRADSARQLIQVRRATIEQVDRPLLEQARLVVIAGVERPDPAVRLLREYVQQGGQLLIAPGGRFDPAAWSAAAWLDGEGILPAPLAAQPVGRLPEESPSAPEPFYLSFESLVHDYFLLESVGREELADLYRLPYFFKAIAADASEPAATALVAAETKRIDDERRFLAESDKRVAAWRAKELQGTLTDDDRAARQRDAERRAEIAPAWLAWHDAGQSLAERKLAAADLARQERPRVLASFTNGVPYLVERKLGRGQVLWVASGVFSEWNTLTKTNAVLIFDRLLRAMLERTLPQRNFGSLAEVRLPIRPDDRQARFTLLRPGEEMPEPLTVDAFGGDVYGVSIRGLTRRGHYRVAANRGESAEGEAAGAKLWEVPLAVNGPESESELAPIGEALWAERAGAPNLRWVAAGAPISLEGGGIRGQNAWKWLMAAVLAGLLAELAVLLLWSKQSALPAASQADTAGLPVRASDEIPSSSVRPQGAAEEVAP